MWGQIGDEVVTEIPPDGVTFVDIYASFDFSGTPVPEGTVVKFLIGKLKNGSLEDQSSGDNTTIKRWTEDEIKSRVIGIEGVELSTYESKVVNTVVSNPSHQLVVKPVAKTTIKPIGDSLKDSISVVAYCSYDKLNQVQRLKPDFVTLTVSRGSGNFLATVDRYSISTDTWDQVAPMPTARTGSMTQFVNGKMYVIGGFAGNFLTTNEEYDPSTGKWLPKASLPTARAYSCSFVYNNQIYILGGMNFSPNSISNIAYKYDPISDQWSDLPPMPNPVGFGTCQVIGTTAYISSGACGMTVHTGESGETENQSINKFNFGIYAFDLVSETWSIENPSLTGITTALAQNASIGDQLIVVNTASLPPYGLLIINEGNASEERLVYDNYDGQSNFIKLAAVLNFNHNATESVKIINLPEARMSPNSHVSGTDLLIFNGKTFVGYNSNQASSSVSSVVKKYDTITKIFSMIALSPVVPRYKSGDALSGGGLRFVLGGSNDASEWQNKVETFDGSIFVGPPTYAKMPQSKTGLSVASFGDYVYAVGGNGSGHEPGWLQIEAEASPDSIRADGRATASVYVTAKDDAGDPPPDGTRFLARGIVYLSTPEIQSTTQQPAPTPRISILPVLFSSQEMTMVDGEASTTLLPRSEDPITQLNTLASGSVVTGTSVEEYQQADESRDLYNAAIEISTIDDYYFGSTDTDSTIAGSTETAPTAPSFSFSANTLAQGLSANVNFFSDIVSVPDVSVLSDGLVNSIEAKRLIDLTKEEIPFGASPYYDAMYRSTGIFSFQYDPNFPQKGLVIATLDNDESFSVYSPQDIIEAANTISGIRRFPIFATSFVVTDPVSLSARRARTDVAELERISFNTGGNSFSLISPTYISFVIERIKTSAPASFGSGRIIGTHLIDGYLSSVNYAVSNISISGNSAEMIVSYSTDGYNFERIGDTIPPNVLYSLGSPIRVKVVKYEIILRSSTFDSPILESVSLFYSQPNIQYLFTYPRQISGQISELASVANYRIPEGGFAEAGFAHGESFMFDRDYASIVQPPVRERGTIMAINRSFDTIVDGQSTADRLTTEDYFVYRSISGNWAQGSTLSVFINNAPVDPNEYIEVAEKGTVAFRKKLRPQDIVTIEITPPPVFRYGLRIANPSTEQTGLLDSFAYEFATTADQLGGQINRPPRAVNLFITPSPVQRGGPMTANYTFIDPDGDEEDTTETKITWYRNGSPVSEIQNRKTISNSNFKAQRADSGNNYGIAKGQEWYFVVTPSDGKMYGPPARSPKTIIATTPPTASNVYLRSSNEDPTLFSSLDTIFAAYEFSSIDQDSEKNTIFTWYVNGVEIKSGTQSSLGPDGKDDNGNKYLIAVNTIRCEIIPSNGSEYGQTYSSNTITIQASPPVVENVKIIPETPTTLSTLRAQYDYIDPDQIRDQSIIYWYRNSVRMSELDNVKQVPSSVLSAGENWYVTVTPSNGLASGELVKSNIVLVEF